MKNVEDIYPLTPLQSGMLFHSLMAPASGVYVNQVTCTLPADLDFRLFQQAWERLVQRHGVLRTAFLWDGLEEAVQVVRKKVSLPWQELDWRGLSAEERQRRFEELRHGERHTPLPLNKAPLMRFSLIHLGGEAGLIWTFHHLLLDGWSLPLLLRELVVVYTALRAGREPALPPVRPFSDYIVWLQKQDPAKAEAFWRRELAGFGAPSSPGILGPAPAGEAAEAANTAEHRVRLSREVTAGLQALAARHQLTLQTVTLGAWAVLLSRYGNADDVVFGSVVSGRPAVLPGVETLVGMFVNTLPARVRVDGAEPLVPWLRRLQQQQLARQELEHTPLPQVLRWSEVPTGSPLFETLYVFENYPDAGDSGSDGLRLGDVRSFESTNYPLTLTLQAGSQFELQLLYDRSRVDGDAALRLLGHFGTLLAGMTGGVDRRDLRVGDLGLLTEGEARQLAAWNGTGRDYPEACIHELFAEQAERSPDAVAVSFANREISYGEIHRRALGLAGRLCRAGVGPGRPVGLCAESLPEMVVGMLGILRAGGAYVPLDLAYPPERLAFLLEDTGAAVLVAEEGLAERLPGQLSGGAGLRVELLKAGAEEPAPAGTVPTGPTSASLSSPGDPAYMIYTSGSTGRPKGVVVPHRAVVRLVRGTDYVQLGPDDRVAQAANPSFDAATFEIWGALLNGGRLVGLERETVLSPARLTAALRQEGITTLFLTTALFNQVAREVPGGFASLRTLLFGGEKVDPAAVRAVLRDGPPARLLHVYGPTETTTFATWRQVEELTGEEETVPIGSPLANGTLYALSAGLHPQPIGVPGELYLGGDGLAHGYHARPELTAERFVPDPFGSHFGGRPGGRLYRTGDLVRQRPDGAVEFLGRLDGQVKIRGFRIEPGEIEAALVAVPGIRDAAVVVREEGPGDRRLIAFLAGEASAEAARAALRERLPDYMVPAVIVVLQSLPLNPNGKFDRRALAALRPEEARAEEAGDEPRTPYEEAVAAIFASVLNIEGMERVGIRDDFFELGGHSLLATQVASRLRSDLAVDLPLRTVFDSPTVAALAREVEAAARAGRGLSLPPIVPVARGDEAPLSFAQEWMWFVDQLDPTGASPVSLLVVGLRGRLDATALERALGELIRRHEVLRTTFPIVGGHPVQKVAPPAPFALPRADLAALPEAARGAESSALLDAEVRRRLDLEHGPLVRALLTAHGPEDHLLVVTLHHILVDGWSMGILTRELAALYGAFLRGEPSPLPPLPVQYADFAVWQRENLLRGESLEALLAYWTERLAGEPPVLELPGARQGEVTTLRSDRVPLDLGAGLTTAVRRLARAQGVTLYVALLAAFQALLHRTTRQTDIRVGSSIANRNRPGIEDLIGYFVNTLVLRGDLGGDPKFGDLLGQLKEVTLGAYAHQDLPFTKLVETLRPDRAAGRTPLFQVMLILQNTPDRPVEVPGAGLTLTPIESQAEIATFDLTLVLSEGDSLSGWLWFNRDLLDPAAAAHLGERFRLLLEGVTAEPGKRLSEISLVTEVERRQLLAGRRVEEREKEEGREDTLRVRLERRAQEDPGAVALVVRGEEVPYGELLPRAEEFGLFAGGPEAETLRLLQRLGEEHRFDDRDVWARLHGRNGLAALETWGALLHGGRVVVPEEPVRAVSEVVEEVVDLIRREGVTVLVLSAEDFGGLARSGAAAKDLRSLRSVILAGAEPEATDLQMWRERYGERRPRLVRAQPYGD